MGFQPLPLPWNFDLVLMAGFVAAALAYVFLLRDAGAPGHPRLFWLGYACFAVGLISPLDAASDRYLLSAHMIQHILITMAGPPLVLAGLPPRAVRFMPRFLGNPWLAVSLFNLILLGWHAPPLYEATLRNENIHVLEHVLFMASAFVFWIPLVGPLSDARRMSPLVKIGYLAYAGITPTVIGFILIMLPFPLYPFYTHQPRLFAGLGALGDAELAGLLMFGLGNLIYFVPISVIFLRISDEPEVEPVVAGPSATGR